MMVGKGHYIPAKTIAERFEESGNEAIVEDFFTIIDMSGFEQASRTSWQFSLRHPWYERVGSPLADTHVVFNHLLARFLKKKDVFLGWYMFNKPDFILSTHHIVSRAVVEIVHALNLSVPVYPYAPDIFFAQRTSVSPYYRQYLISSQEGAENIIRKGQPRTTVKVIPFPLQRAVAVLPRMTKAEARHKLALDEMFTVLLTLGGEGVGNTKFLEQVVKKHLGIQIVVLGSMDDITNRKYEKIRKEHPELRLIAPGFVSNVGEYGYAADIIMGKAGTNTLMESLYMERPCMITDLFSAAVPAAKFLMKHGVGWYEHTASRQAAVISDCMQNPSIIADMGKRIQALPLEYGVDGIIDVLAEDGT